MAGSKVGMISGASVLLGSARVISLDEGSKAANIGSELYDTTFEAALTSNHWRFCIGKQALSLLVATPLNDFTNAFQLPTDPPFLRVVRTFPKNMRYEIYEDQLYSNHSTVEIDYVFKPSEAALPPYFIEFMEYRLAEKMAMGVTGSEAKVKLMREAIIGVPNRGVPGIRAQAMAIDAQQRPSDPITDSPFTDVRSAFDTG